MTVITTALSGMKDIQNYCRSINLSSSEASIIQMIRDYGFPGRKIGGIWESDRDLIVEWRKRYIAGESPEERPKPSQNQVEVTPRKTAPSGGNKKGPRDNNHAKTVKNGK